LHAVNLVLQFRALLAKVVIDVGEIVVNVVLARNK
jgi:hypothetical protein